MCRTRKQGLVESGRGAEGADGDVMSYGRLSRGQSQGLSDVGSPRRSLLDWKGFPTVQRALGQDRDSRIGAG